VTQLIPIMPPVLKIATWNVNGIRARLDQVQDWVLREQPDVLCLQEIKASPDQIPMFLCELEGYWCYWHGAKGYSGVGLHVSKRVAPERPAFAHPPFDYENRIVTVDLAAATIQVAHDVALIFFRGRILDLHDRLEQNRFGLFESILDRKNRRQLERHFVRVDVVI